MLYNGLLFFYLAGSQYFWAIWSHAIESYRLVLMRAWTGAYLGPVVDMNDVATMAHVIL